MRKTLTIVMMLLSLVAFAAMVNAGSGCGAKASGTKAETASADGKSACTATDATKASTAACCPAGGMTKEECATFCKSGDYRMVNMTVEGMTCAGCENSVKASLEKIDGVAKVAVVSYKDNSAVVFVAKDKVEDATLVKTVADKGYKVAVVPAVATTGTEATAVTAGAHKGCTPECAKTCSAVKKTGAEATK